MRFDLRFVPNSKFDPSYFINNALKRNNTDYYNISVEIPKISRYLQVAGRMLGKPAHRVHIHRALRYMFVTQPIYLLHWKLVLQKKEGMTCAILRTTLFLYPNRRKIKPKRNFFLQQVIFAIVGCSPLMILIL